MENSEIKFKRIQNFYIIVKYVWMFDNNSCCNIMVHKVRQITFEADF
jgi:hypothetical protein